METKESRPKAAYENSHAQYTGPRCVVDNSQVRREEWRRFIRALNAEGFRLIRHWRFVSPATGARCTACNATAHLVFVLTDGRQIATCPRHTPTQPGDLPRGAA